MLSRSDLLSPPSAPRPANRLLAVLQGHTTLVAILISLPEFNAIIDATLATLPPAFVPFLDYTLIVVDEGPAGPLFGLYHGAPATIDPSPRQFNTITLFRRTLEMHANNEADLRSQIRKTLLHEIGHHFGLNEDEVSRASYRA